MNVVRRSIRRYCAKVAKTSENTSENAQKGSRIRNIGRSIGTYMKMIVNDYKTAAKDALVDMKDAPVKSTFYLSSLAGCIYLARNNPSEEKFRMQLIHSTNELLLLGDPIRNPTSNDHMQKIIEHYNEGRIRRLNLVVCSLMWVDNFDKSVDLYQAQCKSLKVGWTEIWDHVVDVGVHGKWRWIENAMIDYDINPEEWKELEQKQATQKNESV